MAPFTLAENTDAELALRGMRALTMEKYICIPSIVGMVGFRKLSRIFSGSSDAVAMMWACGQLLEVISDEFLLFQSRHWRCIK